MNDPFLQFLSLTKKSGNLLEGYNKSEDAIRINKTKLLIISTEASQNTKDKFRTMCKNNKITVIEGYSQDELSKFIGRKGINIISIIDSKMSAKLISLCKDEQIFDFGGDVIVKNKSL